MMKKAFTMMELIVAMALVAILVAVTIPLAKNKMDKVDRYSYYIAYAAVQDIAANIVAQSEYEYEASDLASASDLFAERLAMYYPGLKHIFASATTHQTCNGSGANGGCSTGYSCIGGVCRNNNTGNTEAGNAVFVQGPNAGGGTSVGGGVSGYQYGCYIENCQTYAISGCSCTTCASGYTKDSLGRCTKQCTTTCGGNYKLNSSTCTCECDTSYLQSYASQLGNAHINESACTVECNSGYTNVGGSCVKPCTTTCSGNYQLNSSTCSCECNTGLLNSFAQHAGHAHVNASACNVECDKGYTMSGGSCVSDTPAPVECSADQYKDGGICKNCADITSWTVYKSLVPSCAVPSAPICTKFGMIYSASKGTCVMPAAATNLCERIKAEYNISTSSCTTTAAQMRSNTVSGFKNVTPHIKLSNGVMIYIASDLVKVDALSDAVDVRDRVGYLLYVDVNGNKKGKGMLYQDVFPFYILMTGKVLPVYNPSGTGGANNSETLGVNILYDDYSSGNRVVKASRTNVSFQQGACATKYIQSNKYCKSSSYDSHCADPNADCRFIINKPMKFFGR